MTTQNFPIETQLRIFNNEQEIATWLTYQNSSEEYAYDYIKLIRYAPFIYTTRTQAILHRYFNLKNHNIHSFSDRFEELPAWWIDMLGIMDSEYNKAMKVWQRINQKQ